MLVNQLILRLQIKKYRENVKFRKRIGAIYRVCARKLTYYIVIYPHCRYCSSRLIACEKEDTHRLQKLQNHCMRAELGRDRYTPGNEMRNTCIEMAFIVAEHAEG